MQTIEAGELLDNGFVFRDGANHPIERARHPLPLGRAGAPDGAHAEIELHVRLGGRTHQPRRPKPSAAFRSCGTTSGSRRPTWRTRSSEVERQPLEGQGVVEHVWRAKPEEIAARGPRLAAILPALRR